VRTVAQLDEATTCHYRRLVLAPGRPEPRLVERDGFLVVDVRLEGKVDADLGRDERLRGLVEYARER